MRAHNGFALIELIAVLAVLSLLTALAIPRIGDLLTDWRLQTTTRLLAADAQSVRQQAIMGGRTMRMDFMAITGGPHQVRVFQDATELIDQRRILPIEITFLIGGMNFAFNYLGEPVAIGGGPPNKTITLVAPNGRMLFLVLNLAGRIRIADTHP